MADITARKRSRIVTLSEHWDYTQTAIANCTMYARKTRFDSKKDLMHAGGVHMRPGRPTVRRRILESWRNTKKLPKSNLLKNDINY